MKLLSYFRKSDVECDSTPRIPAVSEAVKSAWWHVFTNALYMAVDDAEALYRARDPEVAAKLAKGARNIADAAIEEYESRFGL